MSLIGIEIYNYEDGAIASHPSDKGMKFIADRILENLLK